jgi:DNA (cytosine-5)-methyltransferase 1
MKLLDLFSGIGGFHLGFEQAGFKFDWVGFSEIDKYASAVYKHRFPNAKELGDVNLIQPERLPDHIDFLCGGFPCQAFSMAGKRKGFDDTRGTLFFEIARILKYFREHRKPIDYFVLENVKGLLSHDNGRTFATIYRVLTDIGYTVEFQLLNTRWFLPQNRERIYLVGYFGSGRGSKVFPIGEDNKKINKYQTEECTNTLTASYARATSQGSYINECNQVSQKEKVKVADYRNDEGLRVRKESISPTLATRKHSATDISTMPPFVWKEVKPVMTPNRLNKNQNERRFKEDGEPMFTLTGQDQHGVQVKSNIRRLTPTECERLQGFPDGWTSEGVMNGKVVPMSDTQRYKQCGNAVTVNVVQAVADKLNKIRGLI